MLQVASTKRSNRSNRLMRCEPLWDANALSTESPCPPACRNYEIAPGFFCGVCLEFHPRDQHRIDESKPPAPENAEDRVLRLIREWEEVLGDGEGLGAYAVQRIRDKIAELKAEAQEWRGDRSRPDLPGGIGSLRVKPTWEVRGLDFVVQAWSKGEAVAEFSARLRRQGERGRFSVPISNPKRVKTA